MSLIDSIEILVVIVVAILLLKHFTDKSDTLEKKSSPEHEVDYIEPEEHVSDEFIRLATSDEMQGPVNKPKFANTYIISIIFLIILAFIPSEETRVLFIFGLGVFIGKTLL